MREKAVSGIMLTLLLIGMLTLAFNIQPVRASGTVYIRADGSIDPPTAPISTVDNVTYTFTDDIYADSIVIEKDDIFIDGNGYMLNGSVSGIRGFDVSYRNNVTVKNTKITKFGNGIYVYHSNSCKVLDNTVTDCWYAIDVMHSSNNNTVFGNFVNNSYGGISVDYSSNDNTVTNNTVTNSKYLGWGLYLWASSGNVFSDNVAINNSKGMDIRNAVNNTIHHNNISGNQRGVYLSYSSNNIISQNNITANVEVGIYILTHSSNNIISGNIITNNTYHGLELYENSANNSIVGNTVINNQYGIWLHHYSDYNYIAKNTVTNNTEGIRLSESVTHNRISGNDILTNSFGIVLVAFAENNLVYHNNFIGNTQHVECTFLNVWDNGYPTGGNYWSNYTGVDANDDGIGDTPHIIDTYNQDRYPLMYPWSSLPVHNINTGLGYATIQEAINADETLNGHVIFVEAGTYCENVVLNKTLSLIGEDKETTIVDANWRNGIKVVVNDSIISGFKICKSGGYAGVIGAVIVDGFDNVISDNIVERSRQGIFLWRGGNNTISGNTLVNNFKGLVIESSSNNTFRNNAFVNNSFLTLELMNPCFPWYVQDIDISNTVNGKPIIYLAEKQNLTISPEGYPQEIGILMLINSTNMVVEGFNISYSPPSDYPGPDYNVFLDSNVNLTIRNNIISHGYGIFLDSSNRDVFISNNTLHDNRDGIYGQGLRYTYVTQNIFYNNRDGIRIESGSYNTIWENTFYNHTHEVLTCTGISLLGSQYTVIVGNNFTSNDAALRILGSFNTVYGNNITNNSRGIMIVSGSIGNTIAHNNFINNTDQAYVSGEQLNIWDDDYPSGGNYWSDYVGVDVKSGPGQDLPGSDGIGDTPYVIDANNRDRYPLMNPYGIPPPPMYALTITATVGGTTDPALGTYSYTANSAVQVTAIPDAGYSFDYWELDDVNVGSANPYTALMNKDHTLKAFFSIIPPPLSASISPLSASIKVDQSVTFTSTVSGGYPPYRYQWYLNGAPVSGATSNTWTFTPTTAGIYYVHLKVTDAKGNTAQSETARITAAAVPVGGYSIPIQVPTKAEPIIPYIALIAILTTIFARAKRKTNRKR